MTRWLVWLLAWALPVAVACGQFEDPFSASASIRSTQAQVEVAVRFGVPVGHYLYADKITVEADSGVLTPREHPEGKEKDDEFFGRIRAFEEDVTLRYGLKDASGDSVVITVGYQGCSSSTGTARIFSST